ncbi:MAG: YchJ family protein [Bacteriovoracaceae bacterium]|nr:YchJ family protein [Bacteriovoracaceae bacterium]
MNLCPCSSGLDYDQCCGPIVSGETLAPTAEATMRARYTSFVKGDITFIKSTYNPDDMDQFDEEGIIRWSKESEWKGLELRKMEDGREDDTTGKVEFIAKYVISGVQQDHHEVSEFKKIDGKWYFMDGKVVGSTVSRTEPKLGRNDPCSCGSGKKFKKCCLK